MTRKGKIARLPRHIRHQLNRRLDDGEIGKDLLQWLNAFPEVKEILARDFAGRAITEQNLTEWKQGGFLDWQQQRETCENVRRLVDLSDDIEDAVGQQSLQDRLAAVLAAELAAETQRLLEEKTDPKERRQYLGDALRQLKDLRAGEHAALRTMIDRERWEIECQKREEDASHEAMNAARDRAMVPIWNALKRPGMVAAFGGGEAGEKAADFLIELRDVYRNSEIPCLDPKETPPNSPPFDQTDIKPDQAKSK